MIGVQEDCSTCALSIKCKGELTLQFLQADLAPACYDQSAPITYLHCSYSKVTNVVLRAKANANKINRRPYEQAAGLHCMQYISLYSSCVLLPVKHVCSAAHARRQGHLSALAPNSLRVRKMDRLELRDDARQSATRNEAILR
jgi:hypothetical protein